MKAMVVLGAGPVSPWVTERLMSEGAIVAAVVFAIVVMRPGRSIAAGVLGILAALALALVGVIAGADSALAGLVTLLLPAVALFTALVAWVGSRTSSPGATRRWALRSIPVVGIAAAVWATPYSRRALDRWLEHDTDAMRESVVLHDADRVAQEQIAFRAAHERFGRAEELWNDPTRYVDAAEPTATTWSVVMLTPDCDTRCISLLLDEKGQIHVARGRKATAKDPVEERDSIQREIFRMPRPADL